MKKLTALLFISIISFSSCKNNSYNLELMGKAVERHFKYNDQENETYTVLEVLKPISYSAINDEDKEQPNDAYLCKVYAKGKWSYLEGSRIFNFKDTLDCYFDKKFQFIRIGQNKK